MILDLFTILSLALTVMFVANAIRVCIIWRKYAAASLITPFRKRTESDWLASGIFLGFFGNIVDNVFWALVWILVLFEMPQEATFFAIGSFMNLIFRQGLGIAAARHHVIAAEQIHLGKDLIEKRDFRKITVLSLVILLCAYWWHVSTHKEPEVIEKCPSTFINLNQETEVILDQLCDSYG